MTGITVTLIAGAIAAAVTGFYAWRHHTRGQRCEALWRDKQLAESLKLALDCGRLDFIKTSLARMPMRHATLSNGLRTAAEAMLALLHMVTDKRNTYLPDSLRRQTADDAKAVLINLFDFAQRFHIIESQGHLPPDEEAAKVALSFTHTTQQAAEARAALAKLTFSGSAAEFKSARNKVKAIAWQAQEMYTMDQLLE
jgi:hypothetical protein